MATKDLTLSKKLKWHDEEIGLIKQHSIRKWFIMTWLELYLKEKKMPPFQVEQTSRRIAEEEKLTLHYFFKKGPEGF